MKFFSSYFSVLLLLAGILLTAGAKAESSSSTQQQNTASQKQARSQPNGEEIFRANCVRCHMPPSSMSPRTTGTVIMHMRVRARLSHQDERLLLKYLAP